MPKEYSKRKILFWIFIISHTMIAIFFILEIDFIKNAIKRNKTTHIEISYGFAPEKRQLDSLKQAGYDGIISLLHPDNKPFDSRLIEMLEEQTSEIGLEMHQFPLAFDSTFSRRQLTMLRSFTTTTNGKYYLHSNQDRERLGWALRIMQKTVSKHNGIGEHNRGKPGTILTIHHWSADSLPRPLDLPPTFRNGPIVELERDVYLIPSPTEEELRSFILPCYFENYILVTEISGSRPSDKGHPTPVSPTLSYISEKLGVLGKHKLAVYPEQFHSTSVGAKVRTANPKDQPLLLFVEKHPSISSQAIIQAWRSGVPPLPPLLFKQPMKGGKVKVVKPNVAWGPRPTESEFEEYLYQRGIRHLVYIGEFQSDIPAEDSGVAIAAGMEWTQEEIMVLSLLNIFRDGGPYYIYGEGAMHAADEIDFRWGPAIPDSIVGVPEEVILGNPKFIEKLRNKRRKL